MLTYEDCLGLSELLPEEIEAIRAHEHLSPMVALELGSFLCSSPAGQRIIKRMFLDDIETARARGDTKHAVSLRLAMRHFIETHPDAA